MVVVVVDACGGWLVSVDGEQAVDGERVGFVVDRLWPVARGAARSLGLLLIKQADLWGRSMPGTQLSVYG